MANQEVEASGTLPVHITRETSEPLRRRIQIPTIESQLRVRRLKWWRQLLAPRFAATTRDRIEQGHTWDASLAIRTALLGTFLFETKPPQTTERQRQLLDDAKELVQMHERTQRTHRNSEVPDEISDEFLRWVADLSDEDFSQLHRYDSTLDVVSEPAEPIPCPQCGRTFRGVKGLATHCRSKHGAPVQVIPGQTCPRCQKTISTRSNMMYHYHHHCSQRDTSLSEPSIHQRHQQHHLNRGHLNQDPSCAQGSANTVPSFPSVVGVMSNDPKTSANTQCAVESGGLAEFLRNTAAECAGDVHAFQEAALSEIHRQTGFDVDGTDRSTSANQVPVFVLTCSGRLNPSSPTPVPPADHAQRVIIRCHATNILHLLASAHVRSSGYAGASDEAGAATTEDHATNQRSGDRPCQAHIAARARTPERSTERKCRAPGVRVSPDDAETRSHGRDLRSRWENGESQPGDQNVGHTQGKRPDALFRGVLYKLAENVRENQQVIEQRLQTEEIVAAALKRVLKVGEQAAQNRDLKALRCFRVKSKDEAVQDIVRWIFAPSRQRQLTEDLWTLREAKTLEPPQVHLLEDVAPRTKAAKQVQQLAFGIVPTSAKNQRKIRQRKGPTVEEGDEED